ncbi:MAG: DUF3048 domain-containing protein [Microbacteriaceae bacterium]
MLETRADSATVLAHPRPQHPLRQHSRWTALALASVAALLVGCAQMPAAPSADTSETTSTPTPEPYISDYVEPDATLVSPLTGMIVPATEVTGPSLAAKIDNHNDARPQFGLETTDVVFEELVEGGITRYVAIWYSNVPAQVGPVRSIRPMDPDIISPFGGIVTYSGGRTPFINLMRKAPVYNAIHGYGHADTIHRISSRYAPHNVVVEAQTLLKQQAAIASPQQMFAFSDGVASSTAVEQGSDIARIDVRFSPIRYPTWLWDAASGRYLRLQEGSKDMSASGVQLSATNVLVMKVGIKYDMARDVPRTVMVGSGDAWVSTGGKTLKIRWTKPSRDAPIQFTDADGVTIRLAPGNTWIELMPDHGAITLK